MVPVVWHVQTVAPHPPIPIPQLVVVLQATQEPVVPVVRPDTTRITERVQHAQLINIGMVVPVHHVLLIVQVLAVHPLVVAVILDGWVAPVNTLTQLPVAVMEPSMQVVCVPVPPDGQEQIVIVVRQVMLVAPVNTLMQPPVAVMEPLMQVACVPVINIGVDRIVEPYNVLLRIRVVQIVMEIVIVI